MLILMDKNICGFSLEMANNARRVCSKKKMDKIDALHKEIMEHATTPQMGKYVWDTAIRIQLGYSFSKIHSGSYSYIGAQTAYLATYYPSVYWYCACLRVMSGLNEDESTDYDKVSKAVADAQASGVSVSTIDINKSMYSFDVDDENNTILYGMRALNGVGGEISNEIIANRPYVNVSDFLEKNNVSKTVMISLIKSGAFDQFHDRITTMRWYLTRQANLKKKITMQNFASLIEQNIVPAELEFQKRLFRFNKSLRNNCKCGNYYKMPGRYWTFYDKFFDPDDTELIDGTPSIEQKKWQKLYTKAMEPAKEYITIHQDNILKEFNQKLFTEQWIKYASGTILSWEMDSLGFYSKGHELSQIDRNKYCIDAFKTLPLNNPKKNAKLCGTVIGKNDMKSTFTLLTPEGETVEVKLNRDLYAVYSKRISTVDADGTKHFIEKGWFDRGILLMVNGYRRNNVFVARKRGNLPAILKITSVRGTDIDYVTERSGNEE